MHNLSRVQDIDFEILNIEDLVEAYGRVGGFMAKHLHDAAKLLLEMCSRDDVTIMMSFTGNLIATGIRGLITQFLKRGFIDVIITTTGTIDHDLAKALGGEYYAYTFDANDEELIMRGLHRIGNIIVRKEHYGLLIEKFTHKVLSEITSEKLRISVRELLWSLGMRLSDDNSIIRTAYIEKIPIYVPGFVDGAFGTAILTFSEIQRSKGKESLVVDVMLDEREIMDIIYSSDKLGGLIIGGGISKHHLIWWCQFRDGLDYAIYITTAVEWDGSLSGARPREAISWGKIKTHAKTVHVFCDASIALPVILTYVMKKLKFRKRKQFLHK